MSTNQQVSQHGWSRPAKLLTCIFFGSALAACGGGSSGAGGSAGESALSLKLDTNGHAATKASINVMGDFDRLAKSFRDENLGRYRLIMSAYADAADAADDVDRTVACDFGGNKKYSSTVKLGSPSRQSLKIEYFDCMAGLTEKRNGSYEEIRENLLLAQPGQVSLKITELYNLSFENSNGDIDENKYSWRWHGKIVEKLSPVAGSARHSSELRMMPMEYYVRVTRSNGDEIYENYTAFVDYLTKRSWSDPFIYTLNQQGKVISSLLDGYVNMSTPTPVRIDSDAIDPCPELGALLFTGKNNSMAEVKYAVSFFGGTADEVEVSLNNYSSVREESACEEINGDKGYLFAGPVSLTFDRYFDEN